MIKNEEEIRSKLLLPYISDLGFDLSEITLEDSFMIRLGRTEKLIKGRSDILCKRNNNNLFIIEVKKDTHKINQEDIDQGISYSRALVGNIAPFTIITNGVETKMFDTITKAELTGTNFSEQSGYWKNGCTLSMDEDIRIRYDALINFISFSEENLKTFCRAQVYDRIKLISGDIHSSRAKYIAELHIQRPKLTLTYQNFISSDCSVFGLVGNAGVGKTCSMCSLALESIETNFTFFYNGTLLNESIIDTISRDLNLFFSAKSERETILNKLDELANFNKKGVIIFIDAVDEVLSKNFVIELSEFTYSISKLKNVKLCISCKSTVWNRFLVINETENHTFDQLKKFHEISPDLNNPGYLLKEFDDEEFSNAISIYRSTFKFKGAVSETTYKKLKNGFFLRIFSEVYEKKEIPADIIEVELIEKYLSQSLKRTSINPLVGLRILGQIGRTILKHDQSKHKFQSEEGVDINVILDELNLPIDGVIPQELFDRNILIKSGDSMSHQISFYYSKIRDYIISYHSYRLDKIDDNLFYKNLELFFENNIGQSTISFYLKNASNSQLNVYSQFKKDKLINFVIQYDSFLNEHFSVFKEEFDPKTKGNIGILIPKNLIENDGYALIPLNHRSDELVQYDGFDQPMSTPISEIRIFNKGAKSFRSSNSSLMISDQLAVVRRNIYEQLKKIIEEGLLYEYNSKILLIEKVITILYYNHRKLGYIFQIEDYYLPRFIQLYPVDLIELRHKLYKFRAEYYYKSEKVEQNLIPQLVEAAFNAKKEIPNINTFGDFPPFEYLYKIVNLLIEKGTDKIYHHYLPVPDIPLDIIKNIYNASTGSKLNENRRSQFSSEQVKIYIRDFFALLEIAYKEVVETCFPNLCNKFEFYNNMPHEYIFYSDESCNFNFGMYGHKKSSNGKYQLIFKPYHNNKTAFNEDNISILRGYTFDRFIHIRNPLPTVPRINSIKSDENCVLRNWVYEIIIDDLNEIVKEYDIQIYRPHY